LRSDPDCIRRAARYFGANPGIPVLQESVGHDLVMQCDAKGPVVFSLGEDRKQGTADDVRSL
jgi:hypothetical protein